MSIGEIAILISIIGLGISIDREFNRLHDYINKRVSDLETEIIYKKSKK